MTQADIRDEFITTIDHIDSLRAKLTNQYGRGSTFSFPDHHKLAEGLFLSAWTHWEQFLKALFIIDLAEQPNSALRREIKKFRTKQADIRLAELIVNHPDERRWVEWSEFNDIAVRSDTFLGSTNRFRGSITPTTAGAPALLNQGNLAIMKRIRNAIAHKSDYAWQSFRTLVQGPPFNLAPRQMRGITVGRFLVSHQWNGRPVLQECLHTLKANARILVP